MSTTTEFTAPANAIAVIGMAGRFPGAGSVSAFWDNLRRGEESIATLSAEALSAAGIADDVLANPAYVRRAPLLDGVDEFDADFFGFTPQAARTTDPQHRLFLQCAWQALEDAGCDPAAFDGSIGVYGSSSASGYLMYNLLSHRNLNTIIGQGANIDLISLSFQNDKDFLATRVSHQFDLRGPSIAVQTACSSSLVAVHLACQSLLNGECDIALAGGVSIRIPHNVGYWYEPGSIVSAAGHCRPFDVRADGTVFGSGLAVVVLKPLQAAIDDGDHIHAVIRGSAVNNDGAMKIGLRRTEPRRAGRRHRRGIRGSRRRFVDDQLCRNPRHRHAVRGPDRNRSIAKSIRGLGRETTCTVHPRFGEVEHRPPRGGVRHRRSGQDDSVPETPRDSRHASLHQPQPGTTSGARPLRCRHRVRPVGRRWCPARRRQLVRCGRYQCAHRRRGGPTGTRARESASGPQVLLLSARTVEGLRELRSELADRADRSGAAGTV